jgi:hypothetical protein
MANADRAGVARVPIVRTDDGYLLKLSNEARAVTTHPDRRQTHVDGLAAANDPQTALLTPNAAPAFPIRIAKGGPVPLWLQRSSHPAFFGVDVEIAEAGVELLRTRPARKPSDVASYEWVRNIVLGLFRARKPSDVASYEALRIAPVSPMRPGECLIRYKGGRNTLRVHAIGRVIYDGGPGTVRWVEDGDDLLLMAAADSADQNASPSTLADDPPAGA